MRLSINSEAQREVKDITAQVQAAIKPNSEGVLSLHLPHTTCALTTADLDPGTDLDFLDFLKAITPQLRWRLPHNPAHAPDHILASLIGPSLSLPVANGKLLLGTWQRIVLIELSGPRERELIAEMLPSAN